MNSAYFDMNSWWFFFLVSYIYTPYLGVNFKPTICLSCCFTFWRNSLLNLYCLGTWVYWKLENFTPKHSESCLTPPKLCLIVSNIFIWMHAFQNWVKMTVAYVVIRPVVALSALGAKIGFALGCFIGTLVTNLGTVCVLKSLVWQYDCIGRQCFVLYYNYYLKMDDTLKA